MEPDELFYRCVFEWFRKLAQLSGIDLFLDDFKPTARTHMVISALYVLLASCLWTIYSYEMDEKIICTVFLAYNLQGIVKFQSILRNTKELKDMSDFIYKIYRANRKTSSNKTCLKKSIGTTVFIFKYGLILLTVTAILTSIKPFVSYLLGGRLEPIMPTHFPGINDKEIAGYTILAVFHGYILFVFVIGTAGSDLALMTLVIHCHSMSILFQNAVDELNCLIESKKRNTSNKDVYASLGNLILMHKDFVKYTLMLRTIYNEMCLIQITMTNIIMTILVYVILMMNWFPAYFFMATSFFQVFEYSLLGTIVEIANDNVYNTICSILFTELPIREQKKVIFMILSAQHPHNLTIGGFEQLNVETFIYSMKTTYSVGMLLVNTRS